VLANLTNLTKILEPTIEYRNYEYELVQLSSQVQDTVLRIYIDTQDSM